MWLGSETNSGNSDLMWNLDESPNRKIRGRQTSIEIPKVRQPEPITPSFGQSEGKSKHHFWDLTKIKGPFSV